MAAELRLDYKTAGARQILREVASMKKELQELKQAQEGLTRSRGAASWTQQFVRAVGVFNTLNKGFDFLIKRVGQIRDVMTGWIGDVLDVGGGFQSIARQLEALSESSGRAGELVNMTEELGMSTEFTAQAAASATSSFIQLGFSADEAISSMPKILDLATSRMLTLEEATDIATTTTRQFGLEMEDVGGTIDILNALHLTSGANIRSSSAAMKNFGVAARTAGLEVEEAAAAVGLLGNAGILGTKAGTDLRRVLINISTENTKTKAALEELGISTRTTTGEFRPLMSVLEETRERFSLLSDGEKNYYATRIAGARAMVAFNVLMDENTQSISEYAEELAASEGVTKRQADVIRSTFANSVKIVKSATEAIRLSLFSFIGGPATEFNNRLAEVYQSIAKGLADLNDDIAREGFNSDVIVRGLKKVVSDARPELAELFEVVKEIAESVVTALSEFGPIFLNTVQEIVTPAWEWIKDTAGSYLNDIFGDDFRGALKDLLIEGGKIAGEAFIEGIQGSGAGRIIGLLLGFGQSLGGGGLSKGFELPGRDQFREKIDELRARRDQRNAPPEPAPEVSPEAQITAESRRQAEEELNEQIAATVDRIQEEATIRDRLREIIGIQSGAITQESQARERAAEEAKAQAEAEAARTEALRIQEEQLQKLSEQLAGEGFNPEQIAGALQQYKEELEADAARAAKEEQLVKREFQIEGIVEANEEVIAMKQSVIDAEDAMKNLNDATYELATIDLRTELDLIGVAEDIELYMIEPINEFEQRTSDILGTFTDQWAKFGEAAASVKERFSSAFGGNGEEQAAQELEKISKKQEEILKQRLELEQTAQGRAGIAGELGQLFEERAGQATGAEQEQLARQAEEMFRLGQQETLGAQEVELERVDAQRARDEERRGALEGMLSKEGPAGVQVGVLQQLLDIAKRSGDTQGVLEFQAQLEDAMLEQAEEQAEYQKKQIEILEIIAQNTKLMAERANLREGSQSQGTQAQEPRVPQAPEGWYGSPEQGYTQPPQSPFDNRYFSGHNYTDEGDLVLSFKG